MTYSMSATNISGVIGEREVTMPLDGPRMADIVTGYHDDIPRCNDNEGGRPGGCREPGVVRIALINADGTESRYGTFCEYHAGTRNRFWTDAVAVEHRKLDGTVIRRSTLLH